MKSKFRFDDSLDVVGIHGVGGITGTILLGVFASKQVNPAGVDGLLAGNGAQLGAQLIGVGVVCGYAFLVSWLILKAVHAVIGLRITEEAEHQGLDYTEHSETAYNG
jgi:Amt family ammonium transporter